MNKWLIILVAVIIIPVIAVWMWVRHPRKCWRELRNSWLFVFKGKGLDDTDND